MVILSALIFIKGSNEPSNAVLLSNTISQRPVSSIVKDIEETEENAADMDLPTIKSSELPDSSDYYDREKYSFLHGGIVNVKDDKYTKVIVDDTPIEKPISILSYQNEHRPLNLKSDTEIEKIISKYQSTAYEDGMQSLQQEYVKEQIAEYGEIARQYLPDDAITSYYATDVDNDGIKEKLVTICGIGSNHCSDYAEIIKGNEVVFSTNFYTNSRGISPAPNGFYVDWTNEDSFTDENGNEVGQCCEFSHNKTQFIFKNNQFIPIKQWEVPHIWKRVVEE